MRPIQFPLARLEEAFGRHRVLTLPALRRTLGSPTKMTVFRKLRQLDYRASYSHAGRYYTLTQLGAWDADGLWVYHGIRFSRHGTLLETLQYLIDAAPAGGSAQELETRLGVRVRNALAQLHRQGQVARQQVAGAFVYVSRSGGQGQLQRRQRAAAERLAAASGAAAFDAPQVADRLPLFLALLNEKQRRLYAGFEALKLGRGGDAQIARVTGLNIKTVARGRQELLAGDLSGERIRAAGAGRPALKKNRGADATGGAPGP